MPRYIDLDALLDQIQEPMNWTDSDAELQEQLDYQSIKYLIENQPIADVVPRSKYEKMQKTAEHQQSLAMERWFENNRLKRKIAELEKEVEKAKQEVAREIFAELENIIIDHHTTPFGLEALVIGDAQFNNLKKKYIGEKK